MPYVIRPYKKTAKFRVCKSNSKKCFSKRPMSKRHAQRQLAAIYANSSVHRLRVVGRKGSSRMMSPLTYSPCPSRLAQSSLSDKDRSIVNKATDRIKKPLSKYSPLALCHFIKNNKSLLFDTSSDGIKTKCDDVDESIHMMRKYYKRLNIDSVTSHTTPKNPLTLDKFKKIVNNIFSTQSRSSSARRSSMSQILQTGGQARPNRRRLRAVYSMLWYLVVCMSGLLLQKLILYRVINVEEPFPGMDSAAHVLLLFTSAAATLIFEPVRDHFNFDDNADNGDADNDDAFAIIDDRDNDAAGIIQHILANEMRGHVIPNVFLDSRVSPAPANSYIIIRRNSDMPRVSENLNVCGICVQLLVEPDKDDALKNTMGYVVHLHPGQGPVPHLYHFACIKGYFSNQARLRLPTQCMLDEIDINGRELTGTVIDESVDGTNFF